MKSDGAESVTSMAMPRMCDSFGPACRPAWGANGWMTASWIVALACAGCGPTTIATPAQAARAGESTQAGTGSVPAAAGREQMPARWLPPHVEFVQVDAADIIGKDHRFVPYLSSASLRKRIATGALAGLAAE